MGDGGAIREGEVFAGDYRVVRPLATGGMGAVYVVDQISTGKPRALKLMRPEIAGDADLRRRFEQEARIGARIESEHVVEIVSAGVDDATKTPFMVMELLSGEDLATRIENGGALSLGETFDLFEQLCHAIGAAHRAGIVHRDLKPENVFLAASKRAGEGGQRIDVKVLDFGIAKLVAETSAKTGTQGMMGTPLWMAPEQTERGKVTPAADVWALGLILYNALTGHVFWRSGSDVEATFSQVLKEVCMGPIPAGSQRAREQGVADRWPLALDGILQLCLQRDPAKRYADAGFFWSSLKEALLPLCPPRSSQRIMLAAPAGAPTAAAPPATPLGQTEIAGPLPTAPGVVIPPGPRSPQAPALLASSFRGPGDLGGFPLRAVLSGAGALAFLLFVVFLSRVRHHTTEHAPGNAEPLEAPTEPPPVAPKPREAPPACRLCTAGVAVNGPLAKDEVVRAVEAVLPTLAAQCMPRDGRGRTRMKIGSATLAFTVREGRAVNRRAVAGDGECFARGLGEVVFPANDVGTDVTYTLRFDGRVE